VGDRESNRVSFDWLGWYNGSWLVFFVSFILSFAVVNYFHCTVSSNSLSGIDNYFLCGNLS
jgi:hypothetical protein